jgi:hypothetical protein
MILYPDMINSLLYIVFSDEEVFGFVAHLFDKDPPIARPATVPAPYYSENPPALVMTNVFFDLLYFHC